MENTTKKVPELRFPGFTDDWEQREFGDLFVKVNERNDGSFGKNHWISVAKMFFQTPDKVQSNNLDTRTYVLRKGDIAFEGNKSKEYKYGRFVANDIGDGIISELFPIYRHITDYDNMFWKYYFKNDQIMAPIFSSSLTSSGASSNKISDKDLVVQKISVPSVIEQRRIGAFISRIDNIITLHQRKCEELKIYKKGMLQKMFPQPGETKPQIRFPGFTEDWEQRKVSEVAEIVAGGTPSTTVSNYWNPKEIPWLSSGEVHKKYVTFTDNMISKEGMNNSSAKIVPENSVLIALAGQGKTRGTVAINRIPLTTNQSIAAMSFNDDIVPEFVFCNLEGRYDEIRKMSSGDGSRGGLNKQLVGDIVIPFTGKEEQALIGSCFTKLDNLITLHQRKCEELKEYKKGLLQKMFV